MGIIEARNLTRRFNGLTAVDHVNLDVEEGEIFGFLGPNGAGKTTTIKMLTTLLRPSEGEAKICGYDVVRQPSSVRRVIGVVFQEPALDDRLTGWENLDFHARLYGLDRREREGRIEEVLELVGLRDRADELVENYSGGMKRRLEIARGLIHRPRVLFLDELTEFRRNVLETLRQPLEQGQVVISRANYTVRFPAKFQLVAAMNPCPCGKFGSTRQICRCTPVQVKRYLGRISGPLLDRIGLHINLRAVEHSSICNDRSSRLGSREIHEQVMIAYEIQKRRYSSTPGIKRNNDLRASLLKRFCPMTEDALSLLNSAHRRLMFSVRSRHNIIKVARTIADLAKSEVIRAEHIAEAIQYRVNEVLEGIRG